MTGSEDTYRTSQEESRKSRADSRERNRSGPQTITSLEELLQRLRAADQDRDRVTVGAMLEVVGQKSFGPLLVLAGAIAFSPLSGIPGVPTLVALLVLLTAGQLLCGRKHFWFPQWLRSRSFSRKHYEKVLAKARPVARVIDRLFRPRLTLLTRRAGGYLIAIVCFCIAAAMPPMELLPFAATSAGAALTAFGLALIAHDGVMTLVALVLTGSAFTMAMQSFV